MKTSRHRMENAKDLTLSKSYLAIVLLLMFVLPLLSIIIEWGIHKQPSSMMYLTGKWFLFWAVGVRLLSAGLKQAIQPSFTAREIFHIENEESFIVVRELGFANICLGAIGIISLFIPGWRMAAAFAGGLFFGIAGVGHLIKGAVSTNEWIALVSDVFIFLVMAAYLII